LTDTAPLPALHPTTPSERRSLWIAVAVYVALSIWMAIASHGFLEADGITHYLLRRFAFHQPLNLVGVWGRPLCVLLYAIPSGFGGLIGTRLMSLALVLVMAALTFHATRRTNVARPVFAVLFLLTQPLLFAHSFSELTEVPFATLMIGMFIAYERRWFALLAVLAAIAPLGRPEGFGLLVVTGAALLLHRRWIDVLILPLGLIAWSYAGWRVFGGPHEYAWYQWLQHNWPYSPDSMYGSGSLLRFVGVLPAVTGPIGFGFLWIGFWQLLKSPLKGFIRRWTSDHAFRCRTLVALVPLGVLVIHSILWRLGKMASNGEPRYMLIAAPFWAMAAASGLEWCVERFRWRSLGALFILAGALPIAANIAYPAFPLKAQDDDRLAADIARWMKDHPQTVHDYPRLAAAMPHVMMLLDRDRLNSAQCCDWSKTVVANPPPGVLMVFDPVYSQFNSNTEYCISEKLLLEHGWRRVATINEGGKTASVYLSPLPSPGTPGEG